MKYFPLHYKGTEIISSLFFRAEQSRQGCFVTKFVPDQLRLLEGPACIDSVTCELMWTTE